MFGRKGVKRVEPIDSEEIEHEVNEGFSLEELGSAYAQAIEQASGGSADHAHNASDRNDLDALKTGSASAFHETQLAAPDASESDGVPVTPESILEAMLFLGSNNNRPLTIDKLTECFRGVTIAELDEAVDSLNQLYREHHRAMEIVREPGGYRMQLTSDLHSVRDRFYSKVKETQLTQSAIDCLALVAYQPGITREELEKQWNQPAVGMLNMLVRKGLLRLDRQENELQGTHSHYYTTPRFLEVIGLESLDDLPLAEEL
jgi:segregation and condensation protein B